MEPVINNILINLNSIGRGFCDYAGSMFVQSGALIILLLIIDFLLRKRVRAVFRYCVWMLIFIKLIMPPTLSSPTGIGNWAGQYLSTDTNITNTMPNIISTDVAPVILQEPEIGTMTTELEPLQPISDVAPSTPAALSNMPSITWQAIAFLVWLVGVLVFSALLIQRLFFVRSLLYQSKPAKGRLLETLNQCRQKLGVNQNIELRLSNPLQSPAVCGLFKPVILIPTSLLEKLTSDKLRAVLIHELVHIKRGDLWINLAQTVLQIIYFYNPFVWLANFIVRRIREQAVDEAVLVALGNEAESYSTTLIDIAEMVFWKANFSLRLIGVAESKKALRTRIKHMLNRPMPKSAKLGFLGLLVVIIMAAVLLPMAEAEEKLQKIPDYSFVTVEEGVGFEDIIVGDMNCTGEFIKSKLGEPDKEVKNKKDWWLNYRATTGLGFWVNPQENLLIEIRLNKRFKGKLTSGISMSSTKQDVFDVYGKPIRQEVADDFDERFDNQVLFTKKPSFWRKPRIAKIHYDEQGLLFWFDGDTLDQIVVYRKMETQKSDERKFTATLRNGVMVELIGVCDWTNEEVRKWRPDGIPLNQDIYLEKAHFEKWDDNFGFFAKFTGPEDMSTKWLGISGAIHSSSTYPIFDRQGDKLKDYEGATGKIVDGRASTSIRFGGATGPWRTIAEFDGDRKISGEDNVVFSSPIESKNGTVIAVRGEWKFDGVRRITVTDTKGREHHGGWHGRSSSEHTLATTEFRNLSPKQIQSYKVQFRPYQWVTFNNVSIKPDFKTDVKVEVGKVAQRPVTTYEDKPQWIPSEWLGDTSEKNYALQFDGTDDYVKIPSSPSLDIHGSLTLSAWVKNNGDNDGQIIWRGDNKGGRDPYELHVTNGRMEFRIDAGKGTSYKVQSKEVLDNKGHFWTGVYDKKAGQIYLYKDGVREGNSSIYEEIEYDTSSMWNMIGTVDFGNWQHFRGVIDEVRIWNTARTKKQIKRYMNRSLRGDEANLVACWKFDEGSGQILKDSTKNHNDGQLNNWKGSTGYIRPGANPKVQVETGTWDSGTKEDNDQWTDLSEEMKQFSSKIQQWLKSIPMIDDNLASEFNEVMNEVLPEILKKVENGIKNITELQKDKAILEHQIRKANAEAKQLKKQNATREQVEAVELKIKSLQQKLNLLEKQLEEQEDLFDKDIEPLAEQLGKRMDKWGEQYGEQIEEWFDGFEEKLEEQIEQWEEEFEQQMEEIDNQLDELDEKLEVEKSAEKDEKEKPDLVTSPNLWSRILPDGSLIKLCAVFRPKDKPVIFWDPEGNIIQGPKLAKWDYGNINDKELAVVFEVPKENEGKNPAPDGKFYHTYGWKEIEPERPLVASYARGYEDWVDMGEIMEGEDLGGYNLTEIDEVDMPKFKQIRAKMFWRFNPDFGIRLIAIDKKGKEYPMKPSDIFIGFGKSSKGQQILYYQAAIGLNKKELSHFKLQRRSLAWASFSDFATKPLKNIMQKEKDIPPIGKYALEFDGIDDYLEIHASESLQLGRHFTIQMWIKPEFPDTSTPDNERNLISKGGYILGYPDDKNNRKTKNYGFGFKLTPEEESQIGLDVCQGSNKGMTIVKRIFQKSSDWLHLAVVFDDGEGSVYPGMYFDISPDSYEPALKSNINIGGQFLLPSGNYFKGQIAELRIWNRALTSDEIAEYKTMTLTGNEPNLVACWTFEQTEGREAIDISPYKNDARLGSSYGADDSDPVWVRIEN